ncbi:MAG: TIGR03943 family protein [Cyanobacteria bacterium KgW148]|nr:TIGR03943 family protein [Cyanobacteria bacterium KgW148]
MKTRFALDTLAALVWGVLFLQLWLTNRLFLLIHPNYKLLTIGAGFGLLTLALLQIFRPYKRSGNHVSLLPNNWSSGILLGAGILGLLVPPRPFASEIAFQRGINESFTTVRGVQTFRRSNRADQRSIVEWVRTLNVYPEPDAYKGQPVNVEGFVVHPQDFPDEYILISRFVITCCAADVYPVGLLVKLPSNERGKYPPDRWLRVKGAMTTIEWQGKRKVAIVPQELQPIPEPKNPYDY